MSIKIKTNHIPVNYCSFSSLIKQNAQAQLLNLKSQRSQARHNSIHAPQAGQHLSVFKGQGMDFAESRAYQSGDDIRHIDWRVTARTGKTHTKVFNEQREQPVMLVVDMRKPMFFGTRHYFKSVLAARIASLLAWKHFNKEDKTGIIIIPASKKLVIQTTSFNLDATSRLIKLLADATQTVDFLSKSTKTDPLSITLKQVNKHIKAGTKVIMLSDFRGIDTDSVRILTALSRKSSISLISISDPFEEALVVDSTIDNNSPLPTKLAMTDGQKKIRLSHQARLKYSHLYQNRKQHLKQLSRQTNIDLIRFSTADSSSEILNKLARGL